MKGKRILLVAASVVVLLVGGIWAGTAWAQGPGGYRGMGYGMMGRSWSGETGDQGCYGYGAATGCGWTAPVPDTASVMPCGAGYYAPPAGGAVVTPEETESEIGRYLDRLGYEDLEIAELMEFELNYYAIVAEADTGIGAMELLVDKYTGAVGQEPGPNMMWNAKYGMMGRGGRYGWGMMGGYASGEMELSAEEAETIAQRWLDAQGGGLSAGEADPFYGYYTLHFRGEDGEIEGMLSVHGATGSVWYHSWHGDFIAMLEGDD